MPLPVPFVRRLRRMVFDLGGVLVTLVGRRGQLARKLIAETMVAVGHAVSTASRSLSRRPSTSRSPRRGPAAHSGGGRGALRLRPPTRRRH
eukprot:3900245-Rhodomonas_salina.2